MTRSPRCFVCDARALTPTGRHLLFPSGRRRAFALACASCGVLLEADADRDACRDDLLTRLSSERFVPADDVPYGLDPYTLRIAASLGKRAIELEEEAQRAALRRPHAPIAAEARLHDLAAGAPPVVALGVICRRGEADAVLNRLRDRTAWACEIVILVDGARADPVPVSPEGFPEGTVRIAARPLDGDFAAQRNALQAMSRRPWMLQLDADETMDAGTGAVLGAIVASGERDGILSIGLPRRNLVDGILSDVYPDTQYRLNHRTLRYCGRVHERPVRDWQRSLITLHGAIHHHLDRAHVAARSARYETLDPGRGRLEEARLLLEAYRA